MSLKEKLKKNIAKNLRKLREERGLSQNAMADLVSSDGRVIYARTYQRIEEAEGIPDIDILVQIALQLGVSIDDLLGPVPTLQKSR